MSMRKKHIKTNNLNLRISEEDKAIIIKKAEDHNMTLTDYMIQSAVGTKKIIVIYGDNNGN